MNVEIRAEAATIQISKMNVRIVCLPGSGLQYCAPTVRIPTPNTYEIGTQSRAPALLLTC